MSSIVRSCLVLVALLLVFTQALPGGPQLFSCLRNVELSTHLVLQRWYLLLDKQAVPVQLLGYLLSLLLAVAPCELVCPLLVLHPHCLGLRLVKGRNSGLCSGKILPFVGGVLLL